MKKPGLPLLLLGFCLSLGLLQAQPIFRSQWIPVGEGTGYDPQIQYFDKVQSTTAPEGIFVAFSFPVNDPQPKAVVKKWDGFLWRPLPPLYFGPNSGMVEDIAWYNGDLYLAGSFDSIRNVPGSHGIVRWRGDQWEGVGGGITDFSLIGSVWTLEVYGGELYAGGIFTEMGGTSTANLARWDGSGWAAVGNGMDDQVYTLHAAEGDLYAGGRFHQTGALTVNQIARWDGAQWHSLGTGVDGGVIGVQTIGNLGRHIIAFGYNLTQAGGSVTITDKMVRWDGTSWNNLALPSGITFTNAVWDMQDFGGKLWLAGSFTFPVPPSTWYHNFLAFDSAAVSLDTIPMSSLGEINAYNLELFGGDLFTIGNLGFERDFAQQWCSDQNCSQISGTVYEDVNENCQFDWGVDKALPGRKVVLNPGDKTLVTNKQGKYEVVLPAGQTYEFTHKTPLYWEILCPTGPIAVTPDTGEILLEQDFFTRVDPTQRDLSIDLTGIAGIPSRHGLSIVATCRNEGGVMLASGTVKIVHDSIPTLLETQPQADQILGDTLTWNLVNLMPGEERRIKVYFRIVPPGPVGETTVWAARIEGGMFTDNTPENNLDTLRQIVINAYDPNDKQVLPQGEGHDFGIYREDSILQYLLRFQNTGTDTAAHVYLIDTLDTDLQAGSVEVLGASHEYWYEMREGNILVFHFDNIMLPDSNVDELHSHGHISFLVKTQQGLPLQTLFTNTAHIYFDHNLPVATNTTLNTLIGLIGSVYPPLENGWGVQVFPNPARDRLFFQVEKGANEAFAFELLDVQGRVLLREIKRDNQFEVAGEGLPAGLYYFRLVSRGQLKASGKILLF